MEYDSRTDAEGQGKPTFRAWLLKETAEGLRRSRGDTEQIRTVIFLFLNRAYEARFTSDETVQLLGMARPNVLDEAGMSDADQEAVLAEYERLDPIVAQMYGQK